MENKENRENQNTIEKSLIIKNKTIEIINNAKYLLSRYIQEYKLNNPIAVFDIDDTLFFNGKEPNEPVVDFHKLLNKIGIPVYIITARPDDQVTIDYTVNSLKEFDLKYDGIFFRSSYENDVYNFKNNTREHLCRILGKTIIISIGDMIWDVNTCCHIPVLLPNRNYFINYIYNMF
jgi:hypothetical protein